MNFTSSAIRHERRPPLRVASLLVATAVAASMAMPAQAAPVQQVAIAPQIDSVDPGFGGPGDTIEITGRGFTEGGRPARVTFTPPQAPGVAGIIESFTDSRLVVEVPNIPNGPDAFIELRVSTSLGSEVAPFRYYPGTPGALSAPRSLTGKAGKGQVRLRWGVPTSGADQITGYEYRFQIKGKKWAKWKKVAKGAKARKQVVKKISPKKTYVFEVRAMAGTTEGPAASWELKKKK
jgi:hypothetical protein